VRGEAGYALPEATLSLLMECVSRLWVRRVFEFGSGRSTRGFLRAGCEVAVVEDSEAWLGKTLAQLDEVQRTRFTSYLLPLRTVWVAGAPLRSWVLPEAVLATLREADLVLVDSPAWPPFREHALALALAHSRNALVVVDDANIPAVHRFCQRLAGRNGAQTFQTTMDHGLFLMRPSGKGSIATARPILETLKAWRRYFMAGAAA
jgi:hypothetical protein